MNSEKVLKTVEQILQKRLTQIEQKVLILSWEGQSYKDIEENTGYVIGYLRDIGSGMWKEISEVLQQRVTKKNLPLILAQLERERDLNLPHNPQLELEQGKHFEEKTNSEETVEASQTSSINYSKYVIGSNDYFQSQNNLSFPSAPVSSNSRLYINRPPAEKLACAEIARQGCLLRIKAPQKMGKSSLLNQVIARSHSLGYQIAYIDFKDAEEVIFQSIDRLVKWFCAAVCQQLNLHPNFDYYWDEDMGSKMSCKIFFASYIFEHIKSPLVLTINEVDILFQYPQTASDFLPLLRSFYEQSRRSAIWQKLRLVLVYATDVYIPFKIDRSPFNVGLSIKLSQFNREQVLSLAQRYGLNWRVEVEVTQLMSLIGGHPYLVNIALYYLSQETLTLKQLLHNAPTPSGIYNQHLQSYLILLQKDIQLETAMYQVVNSNEAIKLDTLIAYKLESMGLIVLDGFWATPSCELYRRYFFEVLKSEA